MNTSLSQGATLKDLIPTECDEIQFQLSKSSVRYLGSFMLNLRRPSRTPAFSRKYVKGDPVRLIDWRALARSDQLLIREQREEASASVNIILDASETMQWPSADVMKNFDKPSPTKLEIAFRIALNLAYAHLQTGDYVKVYVINEDSSRRQKVGFLRYSATSLVLRHFHLLAERSFNDEVFWELTQPFHDNIPTGDIVYWVSDNLSTDLPDPLLNGSRRLQFIHVLSSLEDDASWVSDEHCYFEDVPNRREYLGTLLLDGQQYNRKIKAWRDGLAKGIRKAGGLYQAVNEETPIRVFQSLLLEEA